MSDSNLQNNNMSDAIRKAQGQRLANARRAAKYRSARSAAVSNNWPESSYRAHESGMRTIGQDDAERYARRFRLLGVRVTAKEILFGDDDDHAEQIGEENDSVLEAAWEASFHTLGMTDTEAKAAAREILALLAGDIKPALGLTISQAARQQVADIVQRYARPTRNRR